MKGKKLTKLEQAIMLLAEHIGRCPYNDYNVEQEIANILDIVKVDLNNHATLE